MELAAVLPETPNGFCVQTTVIAAGTSVGNYELAEIARDGGRVVAIVPLSEHPALSSWEAKALVVYFSPLPPERPGA